MTRPRADEPRTVATGAGAVPARWDAGGLVVLAVFSLGYLVSYLFRGINISLAP